jgi:sec-independent protein translocase protein TatA
VKKESTVFDSIAMFESPWQIAIVLVIVLVLFGGSRIKDVMGSLGSGVKEFKKGLNEDEEAKPSTSPAGPVETKQG